VREGAGITFLKPSALLCQARELVCCQLRESLVQEETGIAYRRDSRSVELRDCIAAAKAQIRGDATTEFIPAVVESVELIVNARPAPFPPESPPARNTPLTAACD
jgi:hypothetical protein